MVDGLGGISIAKSAWHLLSCVEGSKSIPYAVGNRIFSNRSCPVLVWSKKKKQFARHFVLSLWACGVEMITGLSKLRRLGNNTEKAESVGSHRKSDEP